MNKLHALILLKLQKNPRATRYSLAKELKFSLSHIDGNLRMMVEHGYVHKHSRRGVSSIYRIADKAFVEEAVAVLNDEEADR